MPLTEELSQSEWRPLLPGEDGHIAAILMPGITTAFWMHVHRRCYSTIAAWRYAAKRLVEVEPELQASVTAAMCAIIPADGMRMARVRGQCQLPFWSRLAIVDYRARGHTVPEVAQAFQCSPRTVWNVTRKSVFLNPVKVLTAYQKSPPAKRACQSAELPICYLGK